MEDNNGLIWRKARASAAENGCVEVAAMDDRVLVRDTKARDRGHLAVSGDVWRRFVTQITNKTSDLRTRPCLQAR
jgi:hypothetical protein